ncbi:uncharacterized protein LOC131026079 [Salvia miltiorrhiza]|uniref:uncharacterized protein LOC131026079 n=1 Tax=Salvia miltiorrhiza TaxID=226208 RepID=UPI0025AD1CF5|nr:uncharacterized protein LOC131026079 [Salvia miltiorrhiza]
MVDNAAGGDIGNRTAEEVKNIFETMASNSQQKSARGERKAAVNEATPSYNVTRQLAELTRQVELLRAHAISILRSGKVVDNKVEYPQADESSSQEAESSKSGEKNEDAKKEEEKKDNGLHKAANPYTPPIPFPSRLINAKQDQQFNDFYKLLSKVNVNLSLLDVIRNVPACVKFFKELASNKRKFADDEKIVVSEVASAILQHQLPPKQRDLGSFVIKIALGNGKEASGMLDLGAGVNLMPFSIFEQLELGDLKPTRLCLQLAYRSVRYPKGIVEDILVKVGGLIIPVDFVVLDVGEVRENEKEHTLLLGRPFMETTNTLIDVKMEL